MSGADYWHARLRDGALSAAEQAEFERWRADPRHAAAYAELDRLMSSVDVLMATPPMAAEADVALAAFHRSSAQRRAVLTTFGGAAVLAVAAVVAVAVFVPATHDSFRTGVGGLETVKLPDGSRLTLNTASAARLAFSPTERRVILDRGQALFEVASDPARPFVVAVDGSTVTAVGTVFDVRRDDDVFVVTLVEGVVDIDMAEAPASPDARPTVPASTPLNDVAEVENVVLQAGEQLKVTRGARNAERRPADVEAILGWTDGMLIFRRTRLADALAEVNRYTARPLTLGEPSLADLELSGVFRAGDVETFAWSLEQTFPIRIVERGDARLVLGSRPSE